MLKARVVLYSIILIKWLSLELLFLGRVSRFEPKHTVHNMFYVQYHTRPIVGTHQGVDQLCRQAVAVILIWKFECWHSVLQVGTILWANDEIRKSENQCISLNLMDIGNFKQSLQSLADLLMFTHTWPCKSNCGHISGKPGTLTQPSPLHLLYK